VSRHHNLQTALEVRGQEVHGFFAFRCYGNRGSAQAQELFGLAVRTCGSAIYALPRLNVLEDAVVVRLLDKNVQKMVVLVSSFPGNATVRSLSRNSCENPRALHGSSSSGAPVQSSPLSENGEATLVKTLTSSPLTSQSAGMAASAATISAMNSTSFVCRIVTCRATTAMVWQERVWTQVAEGFTARGRICCVRAKEGGPTWAP